MNKKQSICWKCEEKKLKMDIQNYEILRFIQKKRNQKIMNIYINISISSTTNILAVICSSIQGT